MSGTEKTYRILSLDGGGIRGLITAVWLKRIQDKLDAPLWKYFDLVAGTSIGGLLACGISSGIEIETMVDLFKERGKEIFPDKATRLWNRATRLFSDGLSAPKYDGKGLETVLKDTFANKTFGNLNICPTLVVSYDVLGRQAVIFKSNKDEHIDLPVWEVCRASSAAPGYFPSHVMDFQGAKVPMVDGGVVANNPTVCGIAEAIRINSPEEESSGGNSPKDQHSCLNDLFVVSLGTGESTRPITIAESREWGLLEWAAGPIVDVLFDGSADAVDYIASKLVSSGHYYRLQRRLTDAYDDLDNADNTNTNALISLANQYADNDGAHKLKRIVKQLEKLGPIE